MAGSSSTLPLNGPGSCSRRHADCSRLSPSLGDYGLRSRCRRSSSTVARAISRLVPSRRSLTSANLDCALSAASIARSNLACTADIRPNALLAMLSSIARPRSGRPDQQAIVTTRRLSKGSAPFRKPGQSGDTSGTVDMLLCILRHPYGMRGALGRRKGKRLVGSYRTTASTLQGGRCLSIR